MERDTLVGDAAATKKLYRAPMSDMQGAALDGALPVVRKELVRKELVRDLLPDLKVWNGHVAEKVEGFAPVAAGEGFVVTENDGVDDSSGETFFRRSASLLTEGRGRCVTRPPRPRKILRAGP